jgi:hypothetical protein
MTDGRNVSGPRGDSSVRISSGFTATRIAEGGRPIAEAKSFVSPVRIQDKRYVLGTEIALAAVIAAASVARHRPDQQRPGQEKSQEKPQEKTQKRPQDKAQGLKPGQMPSEKGTDLKASDFVRLANVIPDKTEEIAEYNPDKPHPHGLDPIVNKEELKIALRELPEMQLLSDDQTVLPSKTLEQIADDLYAEAEKARPEAGPTKPVLLRPTVLINMGETLVGLAEIYFHDPNLGWLIADLNREHTKQTWIEGKRVVEIQSRQLLTLPVWEDIEEFYKQRPADATPENLVTIVEQSQVNVELLNSSLSVAMGVNSADPPATQPAINTALLPAALSAKLKNKRFGFSFVRFPANP